MAILQWKKKIATPQTQPNEEVIANIERLLKLRVANGEINNEQLIKIQNLAANPAKLKQALGWL